MAPDTGHYEVCYVRNSQLATTPFRHTEAGFQVQESLLYFNRYDV